MYLKIDRHEKDKAMSNTATDKTKLPESGIVSAIKLDFSMLNASAIHTYKKARLVDHLTGIEITNGGTEVMFSLSGQEAKALDFYTFKEVPPEEAELFGVGTFYQRSTILIPFGEYIGDPKKGLDLGAWDEVDLEVTNDLTTSYCVDKALKCDVELITMQELATPPVSYHKHYEWRAEKPSADAQYVRQQLPTSDLIRRYFIQLDPDLETVGNPVNDPITNNWILESNTNVLDFSFNERTKYVLKDMPPINLMALNALQYGKAKTRGRYFPSTTQYIDLCLAHTFSAAAGIMNMTSGDSYTTVPVMEDITDRFTKWGTIGTLSATTDSSIADIVAEGIGYYNTAVLFDSLSPDEMTYLNPAKMAGAKGSVYVDWYSTKDDHTFRSVLTVLKKQGST